MLLSISAINAQRAKTLGQQSFLTSSIPIYLPPHQSASSFQLWVEPRFRMFTHAPTGIKVGFIAGDPAKPNHPDKAYSVFRLPDMPPYTFFVEPADVLDDGVNILTSTINLEAPASDAEASTRGIPVLLRNAMSDEGKAAIKDEAAARRSVGSSLSKLLQMADAIDTTAEGDLAFKQTFRAFNREQTVNSFAVLERTDRPDDAHMVLRELSREYARHLLGGSILYGFGDKPSHASITAASKYSWAASSHVNRAFEAALSEGGNLDFGEIMSASLALEAVFDNWGDFIDASEHLGQTPLPLVSAALMISETKLLQGDEGEMLKILDNRKLFDMAKKHGDRFAGRIAVYMKKVVGADGAC